MPAPLVRVWRWVAFGARPVHHAIRENDGAPANLSQSGCEGKGGETVQEVDGSERCLTCLRVVLSG